MNESNPNESQSERQLFFEAVGKSSDEERSAFLDGACFNRPELRRRIEALLVSHFQQDSFMEEAAGEAGTTLKEASPRGESGDVIGRYKLLEKLGEGGFGTVWAAEQREPVRRRVALKIIKLGMDTKQVVARFEAERQALALMDHPNIAKVLDAGATETGRPYFVMELVKGIPITTYCDQENRATQDRLELFIKVSQAIQHAHQKGIIHRDIKPSNILVTLHDGVPVPKVIDFGIAKATQQELTELTIYTQHHQFIGTPAYMSPEQAEMSGLDIDTRSDIYSLGVLLYELLTGSTPFEATELMASGFDEMRKIIREREPVKPSTRLTQTQPTPLSQPRTLNATIQSDLDWIAMKCLEKDRVRRYDTANGLAMDIKRHMNNEPIQARPPSATYRFQKAWRRNKVIYTAGAIVVACLVIGVTASAWLAIQRGRAEYASRTEAQRATDALDLANEKTLEAQENAERARINQYASDMRTAQFNLENHNRRQAINLLLRNVPSAGQQDLRGIEWRYLWKKSQSDALQTFTYPDYLAQVKLSPDGRWLVTLGRDQQYYRRDLRRQDSLKALPVKGSFDAPNRAGFSFHPEGLFVAFYSSDGTIHVIETTQWSTVRTFPGTLPIAFTPSGERLIFTEGRDLQAWEVSTGNLIPWITGASDGIYQFACIDPQGRQIALKRFNSPTLELWGAESPEKQSDLETIRERVTSLKSSRDGSQVAAGALSGAVYAWNLDRGRVKTVFNAHNGLVMGLEFSPNGKILATGGADQVIRLWDVNSIWNNKTQEPLAVLSGHEGEIWDLSFSANGAVLASASKDGTAKLWDIEATLQAPEPFTLPETQFLVESNPGRSTVTTIEPTEGVLSTWNILTGSRINSSPVAVEEAVWKRAKGYPEHGLLAVGSMDGKIVVFSGDNLERTTTLQVDEREVWPWTLSPKGDLLMAASKPKRDVSNWSLWELNTGRRFAEGDDFDYGLGAAISPSQTHLVYTVAGYALRVLNLATLETEAVLRGHQWHIHKAVFSNDGRFLATSSNDEEIRIWDTTTWVEAMPPLRGHQSGIYYLEFAPDGNTLLSAANDHTLRFWSLANGQELLALVNSESLLAVKSPYVGLNMVSRDGNRLVFQESSSGGIRSIDLDPLSEIDHTLERMRFEANTP